MAYFGMKIILHWRWSESCELKTNFCPSLDHIEESKLGIFLGIRVITRDKFYQSDPSIWQGKHLMTKYLLFLLPCELHSFLWNPRLLPSSSQFRMTYISNFAWLSLEFPYLCGFLVHVKLNLIFSSVNLSHVNFILSPARGTLKGTAILGLWQQHDTYTNA